MRLVELSKIGDNPLSRSALGAIRLIRGPVGVSFSILFTIARANEHARIVAVESSIQPQGLHYNVQSGDNDPIGVLA